MEKELPKVFENKIQKEINNNKNVYTSIEEKTKDTNDNHNKHNKTINQKINEIINTKKYIYKIPVKIITDKQEIKTKIIGKNNKNIITIDNGLIEINKINEIYIEEEK